MRDVRLTHTYCVQGPSEPLCPKLPPSSPVRAAGATPFPLMEKLRPKEGKQGAPG